jgi:arginine exporter protein ArgO
MTTAKAKPRTADSSSREALERIADLATTDYPLLIRRRLRRIAFQATAVVFALIAVFSACAAGGIVIAERYGAVTALLIIAGAALLVCLAILLALSVVDRSARQREALLMQNRRMAVVGALSLLAAQRPRRSMALLAVLGAILAVHKLLRRRD